MALTSLLLTRAQAALGEGYEPRTGGPGLQPLVTGPLSDVLSPVQVRVVHEPTRKALEYGLDEAPSVR